MLFDFSLQDEPVSVFFASYDGVLGDRKSVV